jgi:hypothetical protein
MTVMLGIARIMAISSTDWCVAPSPKSDSPADEPHILTFSFPIDIVLPYLVKGRAGRKNGEGIDKRYKARKGKAGRCRRHVRLRNPHLDMPLPDILFQKAFPSSTRKDLRQGRLSSHPPREFYKRAAVCKPLIFLSP